LILILTRFALSTLAHSVHTGRARFQTQQLRVAQLPGDGV
jgi:hypothetical protein